MVVYKGNYDDKSPVGVGLGNFDGIHVGHAALLSRLVRVSQEAGIPSLVYTFEHHPNKILFKDRETPIIMTVEQKMRIMEEKAIDRLYLERFDENYAALLPEQFVTEILVKKLNAKIAVVGYDYSFGHKGEGKCADLIALGKIYGFTVHIVPPVKIGMAIVSSTLLREKIRNGDMEGYYNFTGRHYSIPGNVVVGRKVGRSLGFPTANILPREGFALPDFGVYATTTVIDGIEYKSITNVGDNPTFINDGDKARVTIETHIIDYNQGLYGDNIEVYFIGKMRREMKFDSVESLKRQLAADKIKRAEAIK